LPQLAGSWRELLYSRQNIWFCKKFNIRYKKEFEGNNMTNKKNDDSVHAAVAKDYSKIVAKKTTESGCGCKKPAPKGVVAKLAGYTDEELAALPQEAIFNSFGCGNPLAFLEVKQGQVVLDLGCGAGIDLILAARRVGDSGRVIGVDMTEAMIAKAKENIAEAKLKNVEVRKGLIEDLPVADGEVDWVISNCVINLSPQKDKVFKEIARVLRVGGVMVVSDIVAEYLPPEITANPELYSSCLAGAISEKAYIEGLMQAGLSNVKICDRLFYEASL
jgi:arsenite methyltransferase